MDERSDPLFVEMDKKAHQKLCRIFYWHPNIFGCIDKHGNVLYKGERLSVMNVVSRYEAEHGEVDGR